MKVAVAQLEAAPLDPGENARRTCAAVESAARAGADLVVLPELVASGYVIENGVRGVAEPGDGTGPVLSAWMEAAARLGVSILGGFPEREEDRLYNSVAAIGADGRIAGRYRKLHLFGAEKEFFAPGDLGLPIFELGGVRVGVLVCYDLRFPETMRILALEGAELIAVPTAWVVGFDPSARAGDARIAQVEGARVQANLNQVFVACADLCGETAGTRFLGHSLIVSPYGDVLAGPLPAGGQGIELAAVDPTEVHRAQDRGSGVSPRVDRRTDVYSLRGVPAKADVDALLEKIERRFGGVLGLHRALARLDPGLLGAYDAFLEATSLADASLDHRVKELVSVAALTALRTDEDHLVAHMRAVVANGGTETEVLEVLEQVLPPVGVPGFIGGLAAFDRAFPAWSPE